MNVVPLVSSLAMTAAVLVTPLPHPPVMTRGQITALRQPPGDTVPSPAPLAALSGDLIGPDASGVIDLAALLTSEQQKADQAQPVNPFRLRFHPPLAARSVTVGIGALIRGSTPDRDCCVINDQVFRAGERFSGLMIERIGPDQIFLRSGDYHLAIPAADRPVVLRLPQ